MSLSSPNSELPALSTPLSPRPLNRRPGSRDSAGGFAVTRPAPPTRPPPRASPALSQQVSGQTSSPRIVVQDDAHQMSLLRCDDAEVRRADELEAGDSSGDGSTELAHEARGGSADARPASAASTATLSRADIQTPSLKGRSRPDSSADTAYSEDAEYTATASEAGTDYAGNIADTSLGSDASFRSFAAGPSSPSPSAGKRGGGAGSRSPGRTPKLGGFGVGVGNGNGIVPHVEGMRSRATERAQEEEALEELGIPSKVFRRSRSATEGWTGTLGDETWGAHFWVVIEQPSGKSFFANPETGECVWAVPAGTIVLPPSKEGQWWELFDDNRKLPYYFQTSTRETTWHKPEGFVIPLAAIQESSMGKRFSRMELGEDSLAALAALPEDSTQRKLRQAGGSSGGTWPSSKISGALSGLSHSQAQSSPIRSHTQPPPPVDSPNLSQVKWGMRLRSHSGGDAARAGPSRPQRTHFSSGEEHSSGLSTIISSTHLNLASGSESGAPRKRPPRAASHGMGLSTVQSQRDRSIDLATLDSVEMPRGYRRERDPAKRIAAAAVAAAEDSHEAAKGRAAATGQFRLSSAIETRRLSTGEHRVLPTAIRNELLSFEGFARQRFSRHRTGLFGLRKVSMGKMSRWQRNPISAPLVPLEDPVEKRDAVRIFKVMLRVFGDREQAVFWPRVPEPVNIGYNTVPDRPRLLSGTTPLPPGSTLIGDQHFSPYARAVSPASFHAADLCGVAALTAVTDKQRSSATPERKGLSVGLASGMTPNGASKAVSSGPSVVEEERWLLERGILGSGALRDEILLQCMKQLSGNPTRDSTIRGWQLLGVLLTCFPPGSSEVAELLRVFIEEAVRLSPSNPALSSKANGEAAADDEVILGVLALHCKRRYESAKQRGAKGRVPSIHEVQYEMDAAFAPSVFGQSLQIVMQRQADAYPSAQVPVILAFLCDAMLAMDRSPDLFRAPGDAERVTLLRLRIDRGHYSLNGLVNDGKEDVAVLASVLKLFCRELEPPLIPYDLYFNALKAADSSTRSVELVARLPKINLRVLAYIISFLQLILKDDENESSPEILATIFAPNLMRDPTARSLQEASTNSRLETKFVQQLLQHLHCSSLDPSFNPVHGEGPEAGVAVIGRPYTGSPVSQEERASRLRASQQPILNGSGLDENLLNTPSKPPRSRKSSFARLAALGSPHLSRSSHPPSSPDNSSVGHSHSSGSGKLSSSSPSSYENATNGSKKSFGRKQPSESDRWKPVPPSRLAA
ncbi:hypothetical protein IE81DRAFT_66365 [Ceraceosorus guamensis]|uniref:RhoGAP-domain-containing protein n=1 Tax=Ceraceosorus guamensis TaxID=1522189 RepID=A0A316W1Q0_9BASI|nr:hypothetical protein IE81DRAFT_66365 [Ceraceosorus guamensis]PWN43710.1 hypothetical protein IE81DRAFT_66365 [Ceraceosorus guamensis]